MSTLSLKRLLDELIDAYVDWRDACNRVDDAYRFWELETDAQDRVSFGLYMGALDTEEQAAEAYAELVRRIRERLSGEERRAGGLGLRAPGVGPS